MLIGSALQQFQIDWKEAVEDVVTKLQGFHNAGVTFDNADAEKKAALETTKETRKWCQD